MRPSLLGGCCSSRHIDSTLRFAFKIFIEICTHRYWSSHLTKICLPYENVSSRERKDHHYFYLPSIPTSRKVPGRE